MQILVVGLNHETSPVEIRERLALSTERLKEALCSLSEYVPQGIILSTCNRTEVYTLADQHCSEKEKLGGFLSALGGISLAELSPYLHTLRGEKAVRYLFRVASGLESMIVGEYEVLGQVRNALEQAQGTGEVRLPLSNLFQQAVRVGRRARQETAISKNAASVSGAAVELAKKLFKDLPGCKVLVIGAGEAGKLATKALVKSGVSQVDVTSRTYERALSLASEVGGKAVPFHHMEEALRVADIVISCSGSPHYILETSAVVEAMQARPQRPLLLVDIAVPRDIAPEVKGVENAHLYDIDDLKTIFDSNLQEREKEIEKVEAIVDEELAKFMAWCESLEAVPTISALVDKAEKIRRTQLARTLSKMQGLSDEDRAAIDAMTRALVKKILHNPIRRLKNSAQGDNHIQIVQELFDLDTKA